MGFDKNYPRRKDQRKRHRRSAAFDRSCRPGGDCPYCQGNRSHATRKRMLAADELYEALDGLLNFDAEQLAEEGKGEREIMTEMCATDLRAAIALAHADGKMLDVREKKG